MRKLCMPLIMVLLSACNNGGGNFAASPDDTTRFVERPAANSAVPEEIRTLPDMTCLTDNLGTTGLLVPAPDLGMPGALEGGETADAAVTATLPDTVHMRSGRENFSNAHYFAVHNGRIYVKANREMTGVDEPWRTVLLPDCLDGRVTEISVDGTVLLALDGQRWIYTLDTESNGQGASGWTRRWGPYFWIDGGEQLPDDVAHWAASQLNSDELYIDSAGHEQTPAGILTLYALRGDGLRITYMDPWLPGDESREVCGPQRGTIAMAGLSGSGSTVMVISRDGTVYTRLYEFDISGANTMFLDYSWQDQQDVVAPLIQLPAPGWIEHAPIPGKATNRISLHKLPPYTTDRVLRVEGQDSAGRTGYWQKSLQAGRWEFVATGTPLRGSPLPMAGPMNFTPEDSRYSGQIDGWPAVVENFNPYCSPARLKMQIGDGAPIELILHSTDGMRQERRARGLDQQPHVYRSAIEVPENLWQQRDHQSEEVRAFFDRHFGEQRFLTGPLSATTDSMAIGPHCWRFASGNPVPEASDGTGPGALLPDMGVIVGEIRGAEEQGRPPVFCP